MASTIPLPDDWGLRDPFDGFRPIRTEMGPTVVLSVGYYENGRLSNFADRVGEAATEELLVARADDAAAAGRLRRLELLMEAVCRYFNTGGDWFGMQDALFRTKRLIGNNLWQDNPWFYVDGFPDDDGYLTHLFAKKGYEHAVVWIERNDVYAERWDAFEEDGRLTARRVAAARAAALPAAGGTGGP